MVATHALTLKQRFYADADDRCAELLHHAIPNARTTSDRADLLHTFAVEQTYLAALHVRVFGTKTLPYGSNRPVADVLPCSARLIRLVAAAETAVAGSGEYRPVGDPLEKDLAVLSLLIEYTQYPDLIADRAAVLMDLHELCQRLGDPLMADGAAILVCLAEAFTEREAGAPC